MEANNHIENDYFEKIFSKKITRSNYSQFTKHQKNIMKSYFEQNNYPNKQEFELLSKDILQPISKIINWFKHERRKLLTEKTNSRYKKRKVFKQEEQGILKNYFKSNFRPSSKNYLELSQLLKCTKKQVKKWFSYRRIKLKKMGKIKRNNSKINRENPNINDVSLENSSKIKVEVQNESNDPKREHITQNFTNITNLNQISFNNNIQSFPNCLQNDAKIFQMNSNFLWNLTNSMGSPSFDNFVRQGNLNTLNYKSFIPQSRPFMNEIQVPVLSLMSQNPLQECINNRITYLNQLLFLHNLNAMKTYI